MTNKDNAIPKHTKDHDEALNELDKNPDLQKDLARFNEFRKKYWRSSDNSASPMELVLTAHLFLEQSINGILGAFFMKPEKIDKFSFAHKLNILEATGLVSDKHVEVLRSINKIRNNIAHNLEYEIKLKDMQSIQATISKEDIDGGVVRPLRSALSSACGYIHRMETRIVQIKRENQSFL